MQYYPTQSVILKIIKNKHKKNYYGEARLTILQPCAYTKRITHKTKLPTRAIHRHKYQQNIFYFKVIFFQAALLKSD